MMKNNKPILIIDGNNMAHRAYHANNNLSYKGKSTAVIFGVINILRGLINDYKPKRIIMVWDGGRHPKRMEVLPGYKVREKKDDFDAEDFYRQRDEVSKMLNYLGIAQVKHPKMEADDYIHWLVLKYLSKRPIKIISNDKDFHQLLQPNVTQVIHKPSTGTIELTQELFETQFGFPSHLHADWLMLVGDSSDKIPGFPGIGEVRATQFIKEHEGIINYLLSPEKGKVDKVKLKEIYERNRTLIDLEYFYENHLRNKIKITYLFDKNPEFKPLNFKAKAEKYNMKTFTKESFINTFKL